MTQEDAFEEKIVTKKAIFWHFWAKMTKKITNNEKKTLYNHTYSENRTSSASYNIKINIRGGTTFQQDFFYKSGKKCNQDLRPRHT